MGWRKVGKGISQHVAWIPADKAVKGKAVDIEGHGVWTVKEVWGEGNSDTLIANSNVWKTYMANTDI